MTVPSTDFVQKQGDMEFEIRGRFFSKLRYLITANWVTTSNALMLACQYFGKKGDVEKLVKDTCPPPSQRGAYYFTVDLDTGSSEEVVLQQAEVLSPADALCDFESGLCTASAGPGYDLYVAKVRANQKDRVDFKQEIELIALMRILRVCVCKDCIPGPGAHGLTVLKSLPNEGDPLSTQLILCFAASVHCGSVPLIHATPTLQDIQHGNPFLSRHRPSNGFIWP